ncbi:sensor histidine kinase [Paenibacillus eucommiae]|uniref:Two-component system sensor histidine kinase YesM n=1 Tax=Paenibacillus eucommiae TaxID=1355755 RepID=A0ABS4J858_9BACL|nr:sensor histidine kinase [Paenibacillus eucommiae]MBP1996037.1 two-component system sensor histidine kinase YesM [Paenibacillus eucommiae]
MFKLFYRKYIKSKLFSKILLANIAIMIATIAILVVIVSENISKGTREKEINFNTQILESVRKYYDEKQGVVKQMLQQIYYNPDSYSFIFELLATFDPANYSYIEKKGKMDAFLYSNFIRDTDISNIAVYSKNNDKSYLYSSNSWDIGSELYFKHMDWFQDFNDNLYGLKVTPAYRSNVTNQQNKWVFTIGANLKSSDITRNDGVLLVNFNAESIKLAYGQYESQIKGAILIFDPKGEVIFDSSSVYYGKKNPYFESIASTDAHELADATNVINVLRAGDGSIVAGIIPKKEMFTEVRSVKNQIYIAGFICVILSVMLNIVSISLFSKRVKTIVKAIQELPQGNVLKPIELKPTGDELGQIAFRFNIMQEKLIEYIQDVYIAEIKYKNAAFAALQSQINPHFLSNTLEAIRMKAVKDGNEEVADMVYILSILFRNTLKTGKMVKIKEEIMHCELYLKLFSYRYRDKLTVSIDVEKQIMNDLTGKLLLQPIVENCVFHGFDLTQSGHRIMIKGYRENEEILFTIEDNGRGIETGKLAQIQDQLKRVGTMNLDMNTDMELVDMDSDRSIGMLNVHERIKFLFGDQFGLELMSDQGVGTTVRIRVPVLKREELQGVQNSAG